MSVVGNDLASISWDGPYSVGMTYWPLSAWIHLPHRNVPFGSLSRAVVTMHQQVIAIHWQQAMPIYLPFRGRDGRAAAMPIHWQQCHHMMAMTIWRQQWPLIGSNGPRLMAMTTGRRQWPQVGSDDQVAVMPIHWQWWPDHMLARTTRLWQQFPCISNDPPYL